MYVYLAFGLGSQITTKKLLPFYASLSFNIQLINTFVRHFNSLKLKSPPHVTFEGERSLFSSVPVLALLPTKTSCWQGCRWFHLPRTVKKQAEGGGVGLLGCQYQFAIKRIVEGLVCPFGDSNHDFVGERVASQTTEPPSSAFHLISSEKKNSYCLKDNICSWIDLQERDLLFVSREHSKKHLFFPGE